ncbi:MAG TPA: histidine kinase [Gemmatimonadaceae bacterium]|nr:histidine kinase [Gemmatimonadaceae bacterium]
MPVGHPGHPADSAHQLLDERRDQAERMLNGVRALVLVLLATAALAYAPRLPPALNRANVLVLAPMLVWTAAQYRLFYGQERLPGWLAVVNPLVDITAVTVIMGSYGMVSSAALALKSPMFLAYFVILAARPIASSQRKAAALSVLVVLEYSALAVVLLVTGRATLASTPIAASTSRAISPLDEAAKILFLVLAGAVATYATWWHDRLARSYDHAAREREQMEVRLAHVSLDRLKLQLRPHFLFNTLNTITALIATDPLAAERAVAGLSDLLRVSLRDTGEQEVALEHELEFLEPYLAIQRTRFPDRLSIGLAIAPDTRPAFVPKLILQPLVENAIRHGIAPRAAAGRVEISSRLEDGMLHLRVMDDGIGLRRYGETAPEEGIGLSNTRARLQYLYGSRHQLVLRPGPLGGCVVELSFPFRLRASVPPALEDHP